MALELPAARGVGMTPRPTGRGLPLAGHALAFRLDSTGFLMALARAGGDIVPFRLGRRKAFLVVHPDLIRAVLVEHAGSFHKGRLMQRARRLLGDGLLTAEGDAHRAQRKRMHPGFTRARAAEYAACVPALARRIAASWPDGDRVDIGAEMDRLALVTMAGGLLGVDLEGDGRAVAGDLALLARRAPLLALPGGALLERLPIAPIRRVHAALSRIEAIIAARPLPPALDPGGHAMSPRERRDEAMTLFMAGHDTTAASLTWCWHLLATHPMEARRLRAEIDTVAGGRDPCPDDVGALRFTSAVVSESLRLYPPVGRMGRRPVADIEIGGVVLPAGSSVFVSPFVTQRDRRWFPDPDRFLPARWLDPAGDRPRFAYIPFGAGPRACIGEQLARLVAVLALATVARDWECIPARAGRVVPRTLLTVKPKGGLPVIVRRIR